MQLEFVKHNGKPPVIRYTRSDGSITWMQASEYFVRHDLSHFALETVLGYSTAFMGMLSSGMNIEDFDNKDTRAQWPISCEGYYAENMANLFLLETQQGLLDDFNHTAGQAFAAMRNTNCPPMQLTIQEIEAVRALLCELLRQWHEVAPGDTMTLNFDVHE